MAKMSRRAVLAGLSAFVATPALSAWPDHLITITHGLGPGGGLDVTSRIIAEHFTSRLGQNVVVEAKPGAATTVAAALLARSPPDGHALGVFPSTYAAAVAMHQKLAFRPIDDFAMIGMVNEFPYVIATHRDHKITSLHGLISAARSAPQPLLYATPGQGSAQHLLMVQLALAADIKLQHAPFRSGPQALTEVLGKRIDLVVDVPILLNEHIKNGDIRALAITTAERSAWLPDIPTISEAGFKGFDVRGWMGLFGPAGLPDEITRRLSTELATVVGEARVVERFKELGTQARSSTGEELKARLSADIDRWTKVISEAGIERI